MPGDAAHAETALTAETTLTWWEDLALTPWAGALMTLTALSAGAIGSVYSRTLGSTFPLSLIRPEDLAVNVPVPSHAAAADWFWIVAGFTAGLFFLRQNAQEKSRRKAEERFDARTRDLENLILTVTPGFLPRFMDIYAKSNALCAELHKRQNPSITEVRKIINAVVGGIVSLAKHFDDRDAAGYGALVLLFRPIELLSEGQKTKVRERLKFVDEETALENLRGVLDLRLDLTHRPSDDEDNPSDGEDNDTGWIPDPLAMPVPRQAKSDTDKWKALPGAPMAIVSRDLAGYADVGDIGKWCKKNGNWADEVVAEFQQFFQTNNKLIRSFVSLPLLNPESENPDVGVLTLYLNKPDLLASRLDPVTHFYPLAVPLLDILVDCLNILRSVEDG